MQNIEIMKAEDILSFSALSMVLSGGKSTTRVRKGKVPEIYQDDLQELYDYVQVWIDRQQGKKREIKKPKQSKYMKNRGF